MAAKKTTTKTPAAPLAAKTSKNPAKKVAKPAPGAAQSPTPAKKVAKKPTTPAKVAKPVKTAATARKAAKPTLEALTRAAYLNYRRRVENGLPGDSHGDWLEAERTLGKP